MNARSFDIQEICNKIILLNQAREQLLKQELSPEGAWIHEYTVYRRYPSGFVGEYKYAKWQANKPIFKRNPKPRARPPKRGKNRELTNHKHIGRVWSNTGLGMEPETEEAYQIFNNRKQLEAIEQALAEIESVLLRFEFK